MALMERWLPMTLHDWNFFDQLAARMKQEMKDVDKEMELMRKQMFHLLPQEEMSDVNESFMQVSRPVVEEKGHSILKLEFDVAKFKAEEIQVKLLGDNILQVNAQHEEKSETGAVFHRFVRQYQLPGYIIPTDVKPSLTKDGILTIEAAAPPLSPKEKMIPIDMK